MPSPVTRAAAWSGWRTRTRSSGTGPTPVYYEIRCYQARPGRREEWVRYMEDVVIPFQAS
ncbi:hypothetical protein ACFQZC_00660 [Streptacidiphilus monticola]